MQAGIHAKNVYIIKEGAFITKIFYQENIINEFITMRLFVDRKLVLTKHRMVLTCFKLIY